MSPSITLKGLVSLFPGLPDERVNPEPLVHKYVAGHISLKSIAQAVQ